jgi:hypothetical protein
VNREPGSWKDELPPYLVPQEASQSHHTTITTTAQAGQTKEHNEKQDDISDECDNGAESDAPQADHTVLVFSP